MDYFGNDDYDDFGDLLAQKMGRGRRRHEPTDRNDDPNDFAHKCSDSRTSRLPSCHYSDDRFRNAQTVYGRKAKHKSGGYDYSDRYLQWDYDKWQTGCKNAQAEADSDTCDWDVCSVEYYESVLSHFHDKPTTIHHVLTGFNVTSGYSYYVFGYYFPEEEK